MWTAEVKGSVHSACVHSPESWKDMWIKEVFGDLGGGEVEVEAVAVGDPEVKSGYWNVWSVRRV